MMNRILLFLLAFTPLFGTAQADIRGMWSSQASADLPTIKVLVLHDQPSVNLEVKGKYVLRDPHKNRHISTRLVGKVQVMQAISDGLKWGEEFPGIHQLEIVPDASDAQIFVNNVEYKGKVQIYDIGRTISVVNELPVEEYLGYQLPGQYQQEMPDEVLAALAITARTNAFYQAEHPKTKFWSVDAMQAGYKGYVAIDPSSPLQKALKNTRNMVMSQTGAYEKVITPFAATWERGAANAGRSSLISIAEASEMAKQGAHAANILEKAFPRTTIQLMQ